MSDASPWDMSQERAFIENLLSQRFNFFLIVFTVVLAGAATANTQTKQTGILVVGFLLCFLIALTIYRIYRKLDEILKILHEIKSHPVAIISEKIKARGLKGGFEANSFIGFYIPVLCIVILGIAALLSRYGCLKAI